MAITITHTDVCGIADDPASAAAGEVLPSWWNKTLTTLMASGFVIGRLTAGSGAFEELTGSQVKTLLNLQVSDLAAIPDQMVIANISGGSAAPGPVSLSSFLASLNPPNAVSRHIYNTNMWQGVPSTGSSTITLTANTAYFIAVDIDRVSIAVKTLAARITTPVAGNLYYAMYSVGNDGKPNALLGQCPSTSSNVGGSRTVAITGGPITLGAPGVYLALACDAAPALQACSATSWVASSIFGDDTLGNLLGSTIRVGYTMPVTAGTWPATASGMSDRVTNIGFMNFQVA